MKAISTMLSPPKNPRGALKGRTYAKGEVVRVHRDPPPDMKFISKWRNPYEEKGDISGSSTREKPLLGEISENRQDYKRTC